MSDVKAVFFDFDDTLFDHRYSDHCGLRAIREQFPGFALISVDDFIQHAEQVFDTFWDDVLKGKSSIQAWHRKAIQALFEEYSVSYAASDIHDAAQRYRQVYQDSRRAIHGSIELLTYLKQSVTVGIVSNHLMDEQLGKIDVCQFKHLYDFLVCADEVGHPKPHPAMFALALQRAGVEKAQVVMIGDSWSSDVMGALDTGIQAIWFNPDYLPRNVPENVKVIHAWQPVAETAQIILNR